MNANNQQVERGLGEIEIDGRAHLLIERLAEMRPFLMSVLSATDLWMFVSSSGGLTAGRGDATRALFPYETADRLHERPGLGGPVTIVKAQGVQWRPFGPYSDAASEGTRRVAKTPLMDRVAFIEDHPSLGLRLTQTWEASERFGWVRDVTLETTSDREIEVEVLDGLLDVLPAQVDLTSQQRASYLIDAYRHTELRSDLCHAGVYSLSSLLTDRVEPAEALRANVVWREGLPGETHLVPTAVEAFMRDRLEAPATHARGEKGAYLVRSRLSVKPGEPARWRMVLDADLDHLEFSKLSRVLLADPSPALDADLNETRRQMAELALTIDGYQRTGDGRVDANHLANTIFNGLRGGVLVDDGRVPRREVELVLSHRNRPVLDAHRDWVRGLPEELSIQQLREAAAHRGDPQLARLVDEVLPLAFGRRHGDPSRPWNRFSIHTRDEDGRRRLSYEGNWRDIFQNWEATAIANPDYLQSFVSKFASATTVDGYNPYRIAWDGIDWEVPDPEDPWSNIGYWGDHQVIYFLRLLEQLQGWDPEGLDELLDSRRFAFADVPYRLSPYAQLLEDPRDTITFDEARHAAAVNRSEAVGSDGLLVSDDEGVVMVSLWEKLLVTLATKLSNLVLEGGVWMNTQRPEWNDANNALPGFGLSVVTLAQTLRLSRFMEKLATRSEAEVQLSLPLRAWVTHVMEALEGVPDAPADDSARRTYLDAVGGAYGEFRGEVYEGWSRNRAPLHRSDLIRLIGESTRVLERSFRANQRPDGLMHAYNRMEIGEDTISISHLPEMLEGQVAALDAQVLEPSEAADVLEALYKSALYREDQKSFILYPDAVLPDFGERNEVSVESAEAIPTVRTWLDDEERSVIYRDALGGVRFASQLKNAQVLSDALDGEAGGGVDAHPGTRDAILNLYEETFGHASFTGRSRSMYGFEGLGCIYWHMVAKLLLGIIETFERCPSDDPAAGRLAALYRRVRGGFGFNKTPLEYGAFPSDPYSHTPGHRGAQQPGMTGQVKEQVLSRFAELGVRLEGGCLRFAPRLRLDGEVLEAATAWALPSPGGEDTLVELPAEGLGFTLAGVPVRYQYGASASAIDLELEDETERVDGVQLDRAKTRALLGRTGSIKQLTVQFGRDWRLE